MWHIWVGSRVGKDSEGVVFVVGCMWSGLFTKGGDSRYEAFDHVVKCDIQVCVNQLLGGIHLVVGCLLKRYVSFIIWAEVFQF